MRGMLILTIQDPEYLDVFQLCMVINTRSVAKMDAFPALAAKLMTSNCDLCFLTETWLKPIHPTHIVCPSGFCMTLKDRLDRGRGGVAIICREDWKIERLDGLFSILSIMHVLFTTLMSPCMIKRNCWTFSRLLVSIQWPWTRIVKSSLPGMLIS